ncbi:non-heme iron oxygenase ferredoxin subunit [Candidatus Gracilibacteria bacterium]|nr:non-heme iron oxygenase ferredoxin subunit [Candidatus Gracilibacteria bacterium]
MTMIQIGHARDVADNSARRFLIGTHPIAVFRVGDELYAIDDTCSHAEASLSAGEFDADELCVECPLHGSLFDVRSGVPRTLPAFEPVRSYRIWVEDEQLFVDYSA